jgi:hypothetical protein
VTSEPALHSRSAESGFSVRERKFFRVGPNLRASGAPGIKLVNKKQLLEGQGKMMVPRPGQCGFPAYSEVPVFLFSRNLGREVRDIELYNAYWLISDRLKVVFESTDPEAFEFLKCKVESPDDGELPLYRRSSRFLSDFIPNLGDDRAPRLWLTRSTDSSVELR